MLIVLWCLESLLTKLCQLTIMLLTGISQSLGTRETSQMLNLEKWYNVFMNANLSTNNDDSIDRKCKLSRSLATIPTPTNLISIRPVKTFVDNLLMNPYSRREEYKKSLTRRISGWKSRSEGKKKQSRLRRMKSSKLCRINTKSISLSKLRTSVRRSKTVYEYMRIRKRKEKSKPGMKRLRVSASNLDSTKIEILSLQSHSKHECTDLYWTDKQGSKL